MRFIQLLFRSHPIIVDVDTVMRSTTVSGKISIDQPDKTLTFLFSTGPAYDVSDADSTMRLDIGSIVVLLPKKQYHIRPISEDGEFLENQMIKIRAVIADMSFLSYATDAGHTLSYAAQFDIDNTRLLFPEYIRPDERTYQSILVLVGQLINHYYANTVSESYFAIAKWYEIAAYLDASTRSFLRIQQENQQTASSIPSNGRYIRLAKRYVQEHYHEHISVPMIASELKITPNYLSALYKKETGMSITDYINSYRIYRLRERLFTETEMTLTDLCLTVGLQDKRYAQRLFKKYFGVSIQEFQQAEGILNESVKKRIQDQNQKNYK